MNMRERKYVKFKVDMHEDTKFKIIDRKPERDLIHYVWNRVVLLAGKVNREGDLYLSKNIPYTIETLAIEFNRDITAVKLALEVLMELEMVELTEDNIYRVINFAKHQNIKVKKEVKPEAKEEAVKSEKIHSAENIKEEVCDGDKYKETNHKVAENANEEIKKDELISIENVNNDIGKFNDNIRGKKDIDGKQDDIPMLLDIKKSKRSYKRKNKDNSSNITDKEIEDGQLIYFSDGEDERPLAEGESVMGQWSF